MAATTKNLPRKRSMVVERTKFWTKERDDFLRANYGEHMRVDPLLLAINLGKPVQIVLARLSQLGLRSRTYRPD
jgi:hypothetical protein